MAKDANELVVAGDGQIFVAPVGSTEPTDTTTAWDAAWIDLGYASEDGVTVRKDRSVEEIPAWQSFYALRRIVTSEGFSVSFSLLQWSQEAMILAFGGGTVSDTAGAAPYTYEPPDPGNLDERAFGLEWLDGTKTYRLVVPRVLLTEGLEFTLSRSEAAPLPVTLGALGQAGVKPFKIISNDDAMAA